MKRLRKPLVAGVAVLSVLGIAAAVWAYWSAHGSGTASAAVSTLDAPTGVSASAPLGTGDVHVTWTGVTAPDGGAVDGYYVERNDGSSWTAACASSPLSLLPATPTSCDETVADGTYTYRVTAIFQTWTATSDSSDPLLVVIDTTPPNPPVITSPQVSGANSGTFSNGVFNATTWGTGCTPPATICGTASDNVGGSGVQKTQLEVVGTSGANNGNYWNGSAWVSGTPQFFDTAGTTNWSYQLDLPADGAYNLVAQTIDNVNLVSSTTTESVTIDTVVPNVSAPGVAAAVTFGSNPVFVDNETVTLTEAATDPAPGSQVNSVAYFYCVGATGSCTSADGWVPIGSSSTSAGNWSVPWTIPFPNQDGPYRIVAVATDNAGNVSGSSAATGVNVDTTPPTVSRPIVNGNP